MTVAKPAIGSPSNAGMLAIGIIGKHKRVSKLCLKYGCYYLQMPRGVPVATVAIGNAANAGLLAARIIGSQSPVILEKMMDYQEGMKSTVLQNAKRLENEGWEGYKVGVHR